MIIIIIIIWFCILHRLLSPLWRLKLYRQKTQGISLNTDSHTRRCHILYIHIYRLSQEEGTKLREGVPYVKLYRKTPKHLYSNLNGLGDNGNWKLWASFGSKNVSYQLAFLCTRFSARGAACDRTFLRWLREMQFIQCTRWYENAVTTLGSAQASVLRQHSTFQYDV
jgi:hypothetical protein